MFIRLTFQETSEGNSNNDDMALDSKSVALVGGPEVVTSLPSNIEINKRINSSEQLTHFHYYIDGQTTDYDVIEKAIALFKSEYKGETEKRFVANTNPEIFPAIILMKNALQRTINPDAMYTSTQNISNGKPRNGLAGYLPSSSMFSNLGQYATSRNLLFGAGALITVGAVAVASLTLGRKGE